MSLILAIEPDHRRAAQLADLIRGRLNADLVHAHTTEGALTALAGIGDRVPDLVLVPSLLSAQEDAAIAGALRLIADAANVRMLTIPMLADPEQPPEHRGVFAKLRGRKTPKIPGGCDPAVFADQIASYLAEAAAERRAQEADADLLDPLAPAVAPADAVAAPFDPATLPTARAVAEEPAAPSIEPVLEARIELTPEVAQAPLPRVTFKPLVIAPVPPRVAIVEADTAVVRDEPESPSIRLAAPAEPIVEAEVEIAPLEALADVMVVREEPEDPRPFAAEPLERPAPTLVTEAPPVVEAREDAARDFALEDVLQALALEDTAQVFANEDAAQAAGEDLPQVVAIEFPQDASLEETPSGAAIEDPAPIAPELFAVPEPAPEPPPAVARRKRRNARPVVPESEETFDLDALLAPLLSEIAAKRTLPAPSEPVQVAPAEEVLPAVAVPTVEPISPPAVTAIEISEPIAAAQVDIASEVAPPISEAALVVVPTLAEPTLAVAPALDETALAAAAALMEPTVAAAPEPDEPALAVVSRLAEPTLAVGPVLDEPALGGPTVAELTLAIEPAPVEPTLAVEPPIAEPTLAIEPTLAEPLLAVEPPIAEPTLAVQPAPADWPSPLPTLAEHTFVHTPVEQTLTAAVGVAEADIDPMFFADNVHDGTADPAPHDRPAWVELIESLRKDIERLKAERTQPAEVTPPSEVTPRVAKPQAPRIGRVLSIAAARPASPAAATPAERVRNANPRRAHKPVQDQWGLFDPEQCGFAALRAKLDEISAREEVSV